MARVRKDNDQRYALKEELANVSSEDPRISDGDITNWNTAYGWGDHASAGYAAQVGGPFYNYRSTSTADLGTTSPTVRFGRSAAQYMTFHGWAGGNVLTSVSDAGNPKSNMYFGVSQDGGTTSSAVWTLNGGTGTIWHSGNFTDNSANWNTAYSWGNHASAGYATTFNSLSSKTGGTGNYRTSGYLQAGTSGSGMVSLTTNDGGGNANVTFNHAGNTPDHSGYNTGRITVNVDSTSSPVMELKVGAAGAAPSSGLSVGVGAMSINGSGNIKKPTGNYGSINVTGAVGSSGTYSGYSINDRVVFMNNSSTTSGIYNDTNNEWFIRCVENASTHLYYNGGERLRTQSYGVSGVWDNNGTANVNSRIRKLTQSQYDSISTKDSNTLYIIVG